MEFPPFRTKESILHIKSEIEILRKYRDNFEKKSSSQIIFSFEENCTKDDQPLEFNEIKEVCFDFPEKRSIPKMSFPNLKSLYINFDFEITEEIELKQFLDLIEKILTFIPANHNEQILFHLRINCRINKKEEKNSRNVSEILKSVNNIKFAELIIIDDIFYNFSFKQLYLELFPDGDFDKLYIQNFKFVKNKKIADLFEFILKHNVKELIIENIFLEIIEESEYLKHYLTFQENSEKSCFYLSEIDVNDSENEVIQKDKIINFSSISKITLIDSPLIYFPNDQSLFKYSMTKDNPQKEGIIKIDIDRNSMLNYPMKMRKLKIENNEITVSFDGDIELENESKDGYIIFDLFQCKYECIGHIVNSKGNFKKISFNNFYLEDNKEPLIKNLPNNMELDFDTKIKEITFNQCSPYFINQFITKILDVKNVQKIKIKNIVIKDYINSTPIFPDIKEQEKKILIIKDSIVNLGKTWKNWLRIPHEKEISLNYAKYDRNYSEEEYSNFEKQINSKEE